MNQERIKKMMAELTTLEGQVIKLKQGLEELLEESDTTDQSNENTGTTNPTANDTHTLCHPLVTLVQSRDFQTEWNAKRRFLMVLTQLAKLHGSEFDIIRSIRGTKRLYFSTSSSEIIDSGRSAFPEPIPETNYYAATNLSNGRKSEIIRKALVNLGETRTLADFVASHIDPQRKDHQETPPSVVEDEDDGRI